MNFTKNFHDPKYKNYIAYIYGNGELLDEYNLDSKVKVFDLTRNGKFSYRSVLKLVLLIKIHSIDIVHTHLVYAGIIGKLAAKVGRVKYIITTRHYGYHVNEKKLLYRLENILTKFSSVVIAISDAVKEDLINKGIARKKIIIIPNAIELNKISTSGKKTAVLKTERRLIIGSVGRLAPQKDFKTLFESFKIIRNQLPNIKLEIIGDGRLSKELRNYAAELDISDNLEFLGRLPHHSVLQRIKIWDLFVLSSAWEGFGIVLIEAMALQKAVVATNVEGIVDIIDDGVTGLLVPPKSPKIFAQKVINLLLNKKDRDEMGKKGRKKVEDNFSIEKFVKSTKEVYSNLILDKF